MFGHINLVIIYFKIYNCAKPVTTEASHVPLSLLACQLIARSGWGDKIVALRGIILTALIG